METSAVPHYSDEVKRYEESYMGHVRMKFLQGLSISSTDEESITTSLIVALSKNRVTVNAFAEEVVHLLPLKLYELSHLRSELEQATKEADFCNSFIPK